ncbi:hypothetical protein [Nannocystis sp.]|uniref:hypothetical protein n=1 Tax=Nannocystis sp. TaxID=1962667 RepID=UPI002426C7E2|nr:hypothetical protein [Nannocystis sp.]MBK7824568.1 ferrochelatase [Nannocystis sp.]MBK9753180.1 ferrochelatase [Nannocystis sp.]
MRQLPQLPPLAADRLVAAGRELDLHGWVRRSLAPGRELAGELVAVCSAAALPDDDDATLVALAEGVAELCAAQRQSFPDNLCCDLEFLVAQALRRARPRPDPAAALTQQLARMSRLQRLYGGDTAIRFRYVHDFVYGFDWAKWVGRDPDLRAQVGPFDPEFLDHLERRAQALFELIDADDEVYGQLDGEHSRNPFPFSREPVDELRLHRDLAARGLVPVAAWDPDAQPCWRRPYAALRIARAEALGLSRPATS